MGPGESVPQTDSRSVQPFMQGLGSQDMRNNRPHFDAAYSNAALT